MTPAEVHAATLREISIVIEGAMWRQEQAARLSLREAWFMAALTRLEQLMSIEELLGDESAKPERAPVLQRQAWIDWAIERGFKVVRHERPVI